MGNSDFRFINTFKNKDGSSTSIFLTADEMFNINLVEFLIKLVIFCLLSTIASVSLIFVRLYDYEENEKSPNFWGIIIAVYLACDYHYHLVMHFLFSIFTSWDLIFMARFNSAVLITHIVFLIFADTYFYNSQELDRTKKINLTWMVLACLFVSYNISKLFI
jgi:hypothetical protein